MNPLGEHDLKNLRFYSAQFKEHEWQSPWIHWSVFHQTLNEIADRVEELDKRFKEHFEMHFMFQRRANLRMIKILEQHDLLREVAALDDGDDPRLWKHSDLFGRIKDYIEPPANPHASDCNSWVGESCSCITGKEATDWRDDWQGQPEL